MSILEVGKSHWAKGIDPVADAFAGTVRSDVYNMENFHHAEFLIYKGVGTTGTSTITVNRCDDVVPTTRTTIPFKSQNITSGDTHGALTNRAAAGFDTTAGSSQLYRIYVDAADVAPDGFVELNMVEVVDSPVVGAISFIGHGGRYQQDVQPTAIV